MTKKREPASLGFPGEPEKEQVCTCAGCSALALENGTHVPERQADVQLASHAWCICRNCTAWRAVHYRAGSWPTDDDSDDDDFYDDEGPA